MTVKQLIKKLKIFGNQRLVVIGKKDVVGIDTNDDGDVELFLEGLEDIQTEVKKFGLVSHPFAQLRLPNTGFGRLVYRKFLELHEQGDQRWKKFLT